MRLMTEALDCAYHFWSPEELKTTDISPTSVEVGGQWSTPGAGEDGASIKTLGTKAQASFPSSQCSVCHHNHIWEEGTPSMTSLEQDSGNSTLGPLLDYAPCTISLGWFYLFTVDCPYLWVLHLRTQPTSDVLYSGKKKSTKFHKAKLEFAVSMTIYIAFTLDLQLFT